jgi:ER-bound oxygenase mpaB/B'/Rubber oxygenase, catalytic domain
MSKFQRSKNFLFDFFRAQQVFSNNFFAIFYSMYCGLLAILAIPSILNVLVHTNKSSTDMTAYKRYMQTIYHTLTWFRHDLKPGTKAWKSLEAVRKFHFSASRSATKASIGMINQKDMAVTQYGFMGLSVMAQHKIGVQASKEEIADYCHFWRVLGHIIGIEDE